MSNTFARLRRTTLADRTWWKAAIRRAIYTAIAIALPYLGSATLGGVPWLTAALAAALGFVASIATSLAGLPEAQGVDLPWWLAALERGVKTFAQALGAGFLGAVLITDVDWATVLQSAAMSTLATLLRLVLATLPADPTASEPAAARASGGPVFGAPMSEDLKRRLRDLSAVHRGEKIVPFAAAGAAPVADVDPEPVHIVGEPIEDEAAAIASEQPAFVETYPGSTTVVTYDEHDVPTIHNRADLGV